MDLSFDSRGSGLVTLVGPTVFSVGINDRFVVVKQHPSADGTHFDRTVTNYFIVDRRTDSIEDPGRKPKILGPLARADFEHLSHVLPLPHFSKSFRTLEWQRTDEISP